MPKIDLEAIKARADSHLHYYRDHALPHDVFALVARVRELEAENERLLKQCSDLEHKANGWTRV